MAFTANLMQQKLKQKNNPMKLKSGTTLGGHEISNICRQFCIILGYFI